MGLFDLFKKKEPAAPAKPASVSATAAPDTLCAPANGRVIAMTDVPDPVFSGEVLGKGCAVWPEDDIVYAPVSGTVTVTMGHAVGLSTDDGVEVLVHIGVDTVNLQGKGFTGYVKQGDTVKAGDPVIKMDRNVIKEAGYPDCVVLAVSNTAEFAGVELAVEPEATVTADVAGTVSSISVAEGDQVSRGQTILQLTSDTLSEQVQSAEESLRNAQISYEKQTEQLEDYTVTAPITGTIVDKNYNAGETSEANQVLCSIYDLSYLTMTLSVDELDISDIAVGQTVTITADAVEDRTYTGTVTKVSVAGTSSGSATTYPVTIRIDETDGLLPGMSVDATIELASAEDVLAIPSAALNRGDTVLVTADSPSAANGTLVESTTEDGEDYYSVEVTTGVSGDDYIEIVSGLQEGDTVVYIPTSGTSENPFSMMGEMPGGMGGMGGGMPSGGMGGGMPSGGPGF